MLTFGLSVFGSESLCWRVFWRSALMHCSSLCWSWSLLDCSCTEWHKHANDQIISCLRWCCAWPCTHHSYSPVIEVRRASSHTTAIHTCLYILLYAHCLISWICWCSLSMVSFALVSSAPYFASCCLSIFLSPSLDFSCCCNSVFSITKSSIIFVWVWTGYS